MQSLADWEEYILIAEWPVMDHCRLPKDVYNEPYRTTMTCIDWLEHMMYVLLLEGDVNAWKESKYVIAFVGTSTTYYAHS